MNELKKIDEKRYRTTEKHDLLCRLSDEELLKKSAELADWMDEKRRAESARSIAGHQVKEAEEQIERLAVTLKYKQESRTVECCKILDFAAGEATCRRPLDDSPEAAQLVYRRPLTNEERQLNLPGIEEDPDQTPTEGTEPEPEPEEQPTEE